MRSVATKYAICIVHIRESSPIHSLLEAAQDECSAVTRNDLYNDVKALGLAGDVELLQLALLPRLGLHAADSSF